MERKVIPAPVNTPCGWNAYGETGRKLTCQGGKPAAHILTMTLPVAVEGTALCGYHSPWDVTDADRAATAATAVPVTPAAPVVKVGDSVNVDKALPGAGIRTVTATYSNGSIAVSMFGRETVIGRAGWKPVAPVAPTMPGVGGRRIHAQDHSEGVLIMEDNSTDARKVTGPTADGITATDGVIVVAGEAAVRAVGNMIAARMWNQTAKAKVNKVGLIHRGCSSVRKFNEIYGTSAKSWADILEATTAALKTD